MNVSYRKIAKVLAYGMPLSRQGYSEKVNEYTSTIETMPADQRAALQASYIFSTMTPKEERRDMFQDLVACILTELGKNNGRIKDIEGYCYTVAQHRWSNWWRNRKRRKQILNGGFTSLDVAIQNGEGQEEFLTELISGETEAEDKITSELDCQAVLNILPDRVRVIVEKRLLNRERLSSSECNILWRYAKRNRDTIRELLTV